MNQFTSENSQSYTSQSYRDAVMEAGRGMMERAANEAQKTNHAKVLAWAETLRTLPSTASAETTYKALIQEWVAVHVKGQPAGTGAYDLSAK